MIPVSKRQQFLFLIAFIGLIISLFVNLGQRPLFLEEPRRALIALEMIINNNLIVPSEFGELYYKKPPVWNWLIILGFKLFGGYTEFAVRFFSTLSFLIIGIMVFVLSKKFVNKPFAILSTFFFLTSFDLFFHFSQLGEIDLFYSMITFAAISSLIYFHNRGNYLLLFIIFYSFNAIGFLTKAFPSLIFAGLSIALFFIIQKEVKRLFSLPHFIGILIFLIITGSYFYAYHQYNDAFEYLRVLWSRSSERTIMGQQGIFSLFSHLLFFPLETLKNIMPATFLLPFVMNRKFWGKINQNPLIKFSFYMFLVNYVVYWISPGAKQRYIYLLYPYLILVLSYLYYIFRDNDERANKIFNGLMFTTILLSLLASVTLVFIPQLSGLPSILWLSVAFSIAFGLLLYLFISFKSHRLLLFFSCLILVRMLINLVATPYLSEHSWARQCKDEAENIITYTGDEQVFFYTKSISHSTAFYMTRENQKIISFKDSLNKNDFFIVYHTVLPRTNPVVYHNFYSIDGKELFYLIKGSD